MSEAATSARELVREAKAETEMIPVEQAKSRWRDGDSLFVDVRDVREVWRDGTIPDAEHVPRGMLEFWADPKSEYHRDFMDVGRRIIVFCADGGHRSILAARTLQRLGFQDVSYLEGGFTGWAEADEETVEIPQKEYA
jgi:rhodanese-related sulfurtransferase